MNIFITSELVCPCPDFNLILQKPFHGYNKKIEEGVK